MRLLFRAGLFWRVLAMRLLFRASLFLLLIGFAMAMPLHAGLTFTNWTGGGSAGLWTAAGNWDNGVPSTPDWVANVNLNTGNTPVINSTVTLLTSSVVGGLQSCIRQRRGLRNDHLDRFLADRSSCGRDQRRRPRAERSRPCRRNRLPQPLGHRDRRWQSHGRLNGGNGKLLMTGNSYLLINYNAFQIGCFGNSSYATNGVVELHDNAR